VTPNPAARDDLAIKLDHKGVIWCFASEVTMAE
jgi:hypothetical protein